MSGKKKTDTAEPENVGKANEPETKEPETREPETAHDNDKAVGRLYRVTAHQGLNLRSGPGLEHSAQSVLPCGCVVEARGDGVTVGDGVWMPVQGGWVAAEYLEPFPAEE